MSFLNIVYYLYVLLRCRYNFHDNIAIITTDIICMTIIFLSTLIFNEMLILKFCGLNQNTQIGLLEKEKKELNDINISNIDDENIQEEDDIKISNLIEKTNE